MDGLTVLFVVSFVVPACLALIIVFTGAFLGGLTGSIVGALQASPDDKELIRQRTFDPMVGYSKACSS
jgi:hypothetical protein